MGCTPSTKIFHGVNVSDGGKVLIGVCASVFGGVTLAANGAPNEELSDPVAVTVICESEGVRIDAYLDAVDQQGFRISRGRHETDIPKVQGVNGSLERLDGFYGPTGVVSDQWAACGIIPPRLKVRDCGRRQSVGVLRSDQARRDTAPRVLILDDQRPGVAGVFRASENAELSEL